MKKIETTEQEENNGRRPYNNRLIKSHIKVIADGITQHGIKSKAKAKA